MTDTAGELSEETDGQMLDRLGDNAAKWAAEFRKISIKLGYSDMDEDWLTGWFASAIEHSSLIRCLRARSADAQESAIRKALEWQPISSAPKDGVAFLACSGSWITVCHWHRYQGCWSSVGPVYSPYPGDEQPTHWMPLPEPPRQALTGG